MNSRNKKEKAKTEKQELKTLKKQEKQEKKEKAEKKKENEILYVDEILPVVGWDETYSYGIMEDGSIIDALSIGCKNVYAQSPEDQVMEELIWQKLYSTYLGDLKLVSLFFPICTDTQQANIDYIARRTENPFFRELQAQAKEKMIAVTNERMSKEFFLLFYAKDRADHDDKRIQLKATLGWTYPPLAQETEPEMKKRLFFKLCNKNLL